MIIAASTTSEILQSAFSNGANIIQAIGVLIGVVLSGIAAMRSNRGAKDAEQAKSIGNENRELIISGNKVAQDAKDESVNANTNFSERLKMLGADTRKQVAESMRVAINVARQETKKEFSEKIKELTDEVSRLNKIISEGNMISKQIHNEVKSISNSGSFVPVKDIPTDKLS